MIPAQCHCGNIKLEAEYLPDTLTECNCSICRRLSARWLYFKSNEVKILFAESPPSSYEWGDKELSFHHCSLCGCTTHYKVKPESGLDRTAINANMLQSKLIENLKIRKFNGAEM